MTPEERKAAARVHYMKAHGEERGLALWADYCRRVDAGELEPLPAAVPAPPPPAPKPPTMEEKREKALRNFVTTWGVEKGTAKWEDYCRKSGLLPSEDADPVDPKPEEGKEGG